MFPHGPLFHAQGKSRERAGHCRVRRRLAIHPGGTRFVHDIVRQHGHDPEVLDRATAIDFDTMAVHGRLARHLRCCRAFLPALQADAHLGSAIAKMKISAPQTPALDIHKLRERAAGEAGVFHAGQRLHASGHAVHVELHDVGAGPHRLEVILAVLVGKNIGSVFHEDADIGYPLELMPGCVALAFEHPADDGEAPAEERFPNSHRHPRGIGIERAGIRSGASCVDGVSGQNAGAKHHDIAQSHRRTHCKRADADV